MPTVMEPELFRKLDEAHEKKARERNSTPIEKLSLHDRVQMVYETVIGGYNVKDRKKHEELIGYANSDHIWCIAVGSFVDYFNEWINVWNAHKEGKITKDRYELACIAMSISRDRRTLYEIGDFLLSLVMEV